MRIVVISDTHLPRFARRLEAALEAVRAQRPDLIIHCGDHTTLEAIEPFERIAAVRAVAGNNDGDDLVARYGRRIVVEAAGARIGVVHGDGARGTTLGRARAAFADEPVDAIAFGHSHIPYCECIDGRWLVNPGSVTDRRRQPQYSLATLDIERGTIVPAIVSFA